MTASDVAELNKRLDRQFWDIVSDGGSDLPPVPPEEGDGGGRGGVPGWASHMVAFLLGGITWGAMLLAPILWPIGILTGIVGLTLIAAKGRWR